MVTQLFEYPALSRAIVVGLFCGVGLALTVFYSRRGPAIFALYAAFLAAVTLLLKAPSGAGSPSPATHGAAHSCSPLALWSGQASRSAPPDRAHRGSLRSSSSTRSLRT